MLAKGQGRVASGRSVGVPVSSDASLDMEISDMYASDASVIRFHPQAIKARSTQNNMKKNKANNKSMTKVQKRTSRFIHGKPTASQQSSNGEVPDRLEWTTSKIRYQRSPPSKNRIKHPSNQSLERKLPKNNSKASKKPNWVNASFMKNTLTSQRRYERNKSRRQGAARLQVTDQDATSSPVDPMAIFSEQMSPKAGAKTARHPSHHLISRSFDHSKSTTPLMSLVNEAQLKAEKLIQLVNSSMDLSADMWG